MKYDFNSFLNFFIFSKKEGDELGNTEANEIGDSNANDLSIDEDSQILAKMLEVVPQKEVSRPGDFLETKPFYNYLIVFMNYEHSSYSF